MRKRVLLFLLLFSGILLLIGCKQNKDDVVLSSEKQIKTYAKQKYGSAKLLETTEEAYRRTCTFEDKQYGFTYYVASYVQSVGIDGSVAGYTEGKSSDFLAQYCKAISPLVQEDCPYEIDGVLGYNTSGLLCSVWNVEPEDVEAVTGKIAKIIRSYDKRRFFNDGEIRAYAGDKEQYLGSFYWKEQKYISYADHMAEQMTYYAESDVNRPGSEKKKIEYLYYKQMPLSEVPGIEVYELVNDKLDSNSVATVFYFKIDGKLHFYCDVKVWKNHSDRYYSSYEFLP